MAAHADDSDRVHVTSTRVGPSQTRFNGRHGHSPTATQPTLPMNMNVGYPSLLTQPLEVLTNTLEPDPSSNRRKSKLKKAIRQSTKSVLETMPETSNPETVEPLGEAKKKPPLATTPSSAKRTALKLAIDLTEPSPSPGTKITPGSTGVDNEETNSVSSSTDLTSSSYCKENEVIVVSNRDKNWVECHETSTKCATPKPAPAPVNEPSATEHAMSTSANINARVPSSAVSKAPTITPTPKEPIQNKKKRSFHDKILYTMLTSCKPYTLKSLAQATDTTVEALRHAMLSFLDKQLVLSKEFPSKSGSGKEPKKLYWANPIRLSEIIVSGENTNGKKSSGSAVLKEMSKFLATQHEIQEANLTRQELQQKYRAIQQELNPLLAIPTMKQLDDEILATEEKLQHVKNDIVAAKDRMAKQPQQIKPQDPVMLKRKINHMLGEYKTRKRKCMDFVEELSDAMEKKTKDVVGEKILCLDTDEMEWGVWEDVGTGKVFGTKPTKMVKGGLLAGRKNNNSVQEPPVTKIPAKYKDV